MTEYERQIMSQHAKADPIKGYKLAVIQGAMDQHQRKQDNTTRRREKHVVSRQRMIHGRQGPAIERDYLALNEAGNLVATEFGHEAKKFDDVYEASALASRAQRETGGNWQALPVSTLNAEARQHFGIERHLGR